MALLGATRLHRPDPYSPGGVIAAWGFSSRSCDFSD
ncbi:Cytochrome c, class I (cytochrome cM), truncated by an adenine-insersion at 5175201 [Leptolyngbya boryana dg5]|nr:Cytochrome c, class I (cytochrome cM), truncated by an adenine-insersion at 5175201 [Leptolyngbya boryana dg5]